MQRKIEVIRLADIARSADISPETARARARRKYGETKGKGLPEKIDGWLFLKKDERKVLELISE